MCLRQLASFSGVGARIRWRYVRHLSSVPRRSPVFEKRRRDTGKEEEEEGEGRVYLHKSRGQHLLTNPRVLDAIVRKSSVGPLDTVLEIGPGTGNLTLKLLEKARHVVAIEIDKRMVEILRRRLADSGLEDRITVICGDALKIEFPQFDHCVANIPYGISSPLIVKMLYAQCKFQSATLLLQKEFAKRLLANPGDSQFNRLAVNVKLVADVQFLMDVSKKDFVPCPKVDSSLVRIQPKPEIPAVDLDEWWAFVRTCFSKKNKTLGAIFKQKKKVIELMNRSQRMVMADGQCGNRMEDGGDYGNDKILTNMNDDDNDHDDELEHVGDARDYGNDKILTNMNDDDNDHDDELEHVGDARDYGNDKILTNMNDDGNDHDDELEYVGDASTSSSPELALFKDKIVDLLNTKGYGEKRPSKLSNDELLSLLSIFNEAGVYFRDQ